MPRGQVGRGQRRGERAAATSLEPAIFGRDPAEATLALPLQVGALRNTPGGWSLRWLHDSFRSLSEIQHLGKVGEEGHDGEGVQRGDGPNATCGGKWLSEKRV